MSEIFITFIALGILIVVQFLVIDSHLDRLEKKINDLKENRNA